MEEAYAAYLDARHQFANLRAVRGYYPVVALAPDAAGGGASSQRLFFLAARASRKARARKRGSLPKAKAEMPTQLKKIHSIKDFCILWWICNVLRLWKDRTFGGTMPQWVIHGCLHPLRGQKLLTR